MEEQVEEERGHRHSDREARRGANGRGAGTGPGRGGQRSCGPFKQGGGAGTGSHEGLRGCIEATIAPKDAAPPPRPYK